MPRQARYQLRIYDTDGDAQAVATNWLSLDYTKRLNDYDEITLVIDANDPVNQYIGLDTILEVWRQLEELDDWYRDAIFFMRTPQLQITEQGKHLYTHYGRGLVDLLNRREIWYTASAFTKKTASPGETAMKAYVNENAGSGAISPPRKATGITLGLSIAVDSGLGLAWTGDRAQRNLLDTLQEIAGATNVDFGVTRLGYTGALFLFYTGYPQLGADLSTAVRFSTLNGNMNNPIYVNSRTEEVTIVNALGQASGTTRQSLIKSDDLRLAQSPWNRIERTVNASQETTNAGLDSSASAALAKLAPQESFSFTVLQTDTTRYGRDYTVGDKISAQILDIVRVLKVTEAHINVSESNEQIGISFALNGRIT